MVPGDVEMCNGVSLYIANSQKTKEMVEDLFPEEKKTSAEDKKTNNIINNTTSKK